MCRLRTGQCPAVKVACCTVNLGMSNVDPSCKAVPAEEKEAGYGRWHVLEVALELIRGLLVEKEAGSTEQGSALWVG